MSVAYVEPVSAAGRIESLKAGLRQWSEAQAIPIEKFAEDCTWVPLREDPELRVTGTGKKSAARVELDEWFLYEFAGDLICRVTEFSDRAKALQAAGLQEGT